MMFSRGSQRHLLLGSSPTCLRGRDSACCALDGPSRSLHAAVTVATTATRAFGTPVKCSALQACVQTNVHARHPARALLQLHSARRCNITHTRLSKHGSSNSGAGRMIAVSVLQPRTSLSIRGEEPAGQISVISRDGKLYTVNFIPGTSTTRNLRASVAEHMGVAPDAVRLAYQGRELSLADDNTIFEKHPEADVMHAMKKEATQAMTASTVPEAPHDKLKVYTMEGRVLSLSMTPGTTTAGNIRKEVAAAMGAAAPEIRLHYAGKELDPALDGKPIDLKSLAKSTGKDYNMHAMTRMKGGMKFYASSFRSYNTGQTAGSSVWNGPVGGSIAKSSGLHWRLQSMNTVHAPGAGRGVGQPRKVQLAKQFRDLMKHPIPGVSVAPDEIDMLTWHAMVAGPTDTPYAGGWFHLQLTFASSFPGTAPDMKFKTKMWHPNVSAADGRVCMDVGVNARSVACLLAAVQLLLAHPNTESVLNGDCAREMTVEPSQYWEIARQMTQLYAMNELK